MLRLERLQSHEVRQREAASLLRQQAVWASIGNLVSKDFMSPTNRGGSNSGGEEKKEEQQQQEQAETTVRSPQQEQQQREWEQEQSASATTVKLEIGDDGRVKVNAGEASEKEESIKEKVHRMRAEVIFFNCP